MMARKEVIKIVLREEEVVVESVALQTLLLILPIFLLINS